MGIAKRKAPARGVRKPPARAARTAGGARGTRTTTTPTPKTTPTLEGLEMRLASLEQRLEWLEHPSTSSEHARALADEP
jgi:hypothetical protein